MKQHIKSISSVVFVEYDKPTKCNKCFFADDKEQCNMHKCNSNERMDGKNGYYRKTNAPTTVEFVSSYDNTKQVIR